jgi:hypothetical protein
VVVADGEAAGGILFDGAEALGDVLSDRFQRLVPGPMQGGVDADALVRAMFDGDEDRDLALLHREACSHVGAPHHVDGVRDDRAIVAARAARTAGPVRGPEAVLARQAAHPLL